MVIPSGKAGSKRRPDLVILERQEQSGGEQQEAQRSPARDQGAATSPGITRRVWEGAQCTPGSLGKPQTHRGSTWGGAAGAVIPKTFLSQPSSTAGAWAFQISCLKNSAQFHLRAWLQQQLCWQSLGNALLLLPEQGTLRHPPQLPFPWDGGMGAQQEMLAQRAPKAQRQRWVQCLT